MGAFHTSCFNVMRFYCGCFFCTFLILLVLIQVEFKNIEVKYYFFYTQYFFYGLSLIHINIDHPLHSLHLNFMPSYRCFLETWVLIQVDCAWQFFAHPYEGCFLVQLFLKKAGKKIVFSIVGML